MIDGHELESDDGHELESGLVRQTKHMTCHCLDGHELRILVMVTSSNPAWCGSITSQKQSHATVLMVMSLNPMMGSQARIRPGADQAHHKKASHAIV